MSPPPHRFESWSKPLARFTMYRNAIIATAEKISSTKDSEKRSLMVRPRSLSQRGKLANAELGQPCPVGRALSGCRSASLKDGNLAADAWTFKELLDPEALLTIGLLADACDEGMWLTREMEDR